MEKDTKCAAAPTTTPGAKSILKNILTFAACVAVMAVVAFAYFYPDASQGRILQQYDVQQGIANGQEAKAFTEATGETTWWTNSLFSGMPTFQTSPTYSSNHLFDWINTVMGLGLPSPANLLAMMMIGMFILLIAMKQRWYVALLGALAYGFSSYFIIIIGAGHIWKFITLAYIPPTIAGIVLCYRGRYLLGGALTALFAMMQIASNHIQMTYYFLFVILGFVVVYLCYAIKEKNYKQFGISTLVVVVAGALAVTANLPSLYHTYEYSKETIRGGHSELTNKAAADDPNATDGLNRSYITAYSYEPSETFTLLIPDVKGGASGKSLADLPEVQNRINEGRIDEATQWYISMVPQYFGGEEGTSGPVYIGALIFALFLVGCVVVKGPMKWMLIVLTLLSIFLAMGRHLQWLTDLFIDYMPMYSKFRTVESILVIAEFTMPLMAVLALQKLLTEKDAWKKYHWAIIFGFGVSLLLCFMAIAAPGIYGAGVTKADMDMDAQILSYYSAMGYSSQELASLPSLQDPAVYDAVESLRFSMVRSDALRSFFIVALGLGVLMIFYFTKRSDKNEEGNRRSAIVAALALAVIVLLDLYLVNKRYLNTESFHDKPDPEMAAIPRSAIDDMILRDSTMNYRVLDINNFDRPQPSYYHKMLGGYHAAKLTRYQDLIDRHLSNVTHGIPTEADVNVVNMLNAKYILPSFSSPSPYAELEQLGAGWFVDSIIYTDGPEDVDYDKIDILATAVANKKFKPLLGEATAPVAGDTIIEYPADAETRAQQLTYMVSSANGGVAVFPAAAYPRMWRAVVDGQMVDGPARVDDGISALRIPAGQHDVILYVDVENTEAYGNAWLVDEIRYVDNADAEMEALSHINTAHVAVADKKFKDTLGEAIAPAPGDTVYETSYAPNRLSYKVKTAKGGIVVFSENYFPWGWNVTIDGKEAPAPARVDYVLRAIRVPAGEHEIVMTFDPQSIHTTQTAATVSVILIYVALALAIAFAIMKALGKKCPCCCKKKSTEKEG